MSYSTPSSSQPITIAGSTLSATYGLLAIALALSVVGAVLGMMFANVLLSSGILMIMLIGEVAIILTSRMWMRSTPLNYLLFALFPMFSGITITPYILSILVGYANGAAIIVNAGIATVLMVAAAAVFARTTSWNLGVMAQALFLGLIGLIILSVLQLFIPSIRSGQFELMISGLGIVIFAGFTAYDFQRVAHAARAGESPFILALSLYLDIFNLFLYILRFMSAMSGRRRDW